MWWPTWTSLLALALLWTVTVPLGRAAPQEVILKVKTQEPRTSVWAGSLHAMAEDVYQMTSQIGEPVRLKLFYNAVETRLVGELRANTLDGAALDDEQQLIVQRDAAVLQLPGLFRSWSDVDAGRARVQLQLDAGFKAEGLELLAFTDRGGVVLMGTDGALGAPGSLASRKVRVTPSYASSALVFRTAVLEQLSDEQRDILEGRAKAFAQVASAKVRDLDRQAFTRLVSKLRVHDATAAEKTAWELQFSQARASLKGMISSAVYRLLCDGHSFGGRC